MTKLYAIPWFTALMAAPILVDSPGNAEHQWPQWRGPLASGVAPHGDPPVEWSETKNIRWKVALPGRGNATPIVWNDRIYVLTAIPTDRVAPAPAPADAPPAEHMFSQEPPGDRPPRQGPPGDGPPRDSGRRGPPRTEKPTNIYEFAVLALDRKTGATVWKKTVREALPHEGTHPDSTFASCSPVTDGTHLFAYFGSHGLYCLDLQGNVKWEKDFGDMRTRNSFGEGSSPALFRDTLVINWDHEGDDFIVALDKKTGSELWRVPRDEPTTWATPLIVESSGQAQVITGGANRIRSYDLSSGQLVWEGGGLTASVIPSPVAADGLAYLVSGHRGNALKAIRLSEAHGDLGTSHPAIVWTYDKDTPYVPSPLLYDDAFYMLENNRAVLTRLNARTGAVDYGPQRMEGVQNIYASPVGAAGKVYICGRDGKTVVLKYGPTFEVLATNSLDETFDASPAIAGTELFLRGHQNMYCIAAK